LGLALDEPEENEKPVQINGLDVLISDEVKPFTDGNTLDYVKYPDGEGFVLTPESGGNRC
jgi:Fe-S cluster assembly iron-binding protein IscA